jgi:hypothetical protein
MSERRDTPAQLSGKHLANESLSLLDSKYEADTNQDIRDYVRAKINKTETLRKQIEIIANSINEFIDVITEKSEKNFLYLRYMLPNIEEGVYQSITKLDSLPKGLQDYYEKHWERMGMMSSPLPKTKLYVIYHLSESYRAISREQVAKYIGETNITVQEILDEWLQFLHKQNIKDEICYKIYHQSFQDFLNRIDIIQAAGIDLKEINKQKTRILNKIWRNLRDSK